MAIKLPFLSKGAKEGFADEAAQTGSNSLDAANSILADIHSDTSIVSIGMGASKTSGQRNLNATFIGDALQKTGDIRLPLIGHLPLQHQVQILLTMLGGSLVSSALFVWLNSNHSILASTQTQIAGDALMHSQRIGKATPNAIQGNVEAFKQLEESRKELGRDLNVLLNGGNYQGREIDLPSAAMIPLLKDAQKIWNNSDKAAETVFKFKKELMGFGATLQKLNTLSPVLLELTEQIATLKVRNGASPREISAAGQLVMLTQRLGRSANEFLTSEGVNPETAFLLGKDTNTFRDITEGFLNGSDVLRLAATKDPDTREKLAQLQSAFVEYQQLVATILGNLQNFIAAKQSSS